MKIRHNRAAKTRQMKLISVAVTSCFASSLAFANPTGPTVVNGTVSVVPMGNVLQITNSPNSIINWQSFSIGAGELTRFIQQSSASAVLNRVITQNPSTILGALQSNGRVFLINPNGIVFGAGSQIDVAGLVASTLSLSDADFLAGRMRFTEVPGAGSVVNQGNITTPAGGQVYLVGPAVTNSGIITSPQGEVILAAGNSVELVDAGTPNLRVEIVAPDNQALNLGQIIADSGRVGIYAGLINQSGRIQANTAVATEDGRIVLKATNSATFAPGSVTTATGPLELEAGDITVASNITSGPQTITAGSGLIVQSSAAGPAQLSATGGQTINARFIEVTAQDNNAAGIFNSTSGDQVITVAGGGLSPGIDVRSLASGGSASIGNNAPGAAQVINVTDADHINVNGFGPNISNVSAIIHAIPGTQTISITGSGANAINVGSVGALGGSNINARSQSITAGTSGQSGSINIVGPAVNSRLAAISTNVGFPGTQTVSTSGALTVTGGNAPAQTFTSGINHNSNGPQTVTAARITLQGGLTGSGNSAQFFSASGAQTVSASEITLTGGASGSSNVARIQNNSTGPQTITGSPIITITGGTGGIVDQGNSASIFSTGPQDITAASIDITAGGAGFNNFAGINAPVQVITVRGDLTLTGGASASGPLRDGAARIGGRPNPATPTNLTLTVGGDVTMNGGSMAFAGPVIGSHFLGGQPTNITMNVGGNLTLGTGTSANSSARIGSPSASSAGGSISITAGGDITLENATNQSGTRSVIRTLDSLTLNANNITVGGSVISGPQTINAADDITVAAPNATNAIVTATGPQTITAGGTLTVQGGAGTGRSAQILGSAGQTISASSINVTGGSVGNSSFAEIRQLGAAAGQSINASDTITITGGASGTDNFARIRNDGIGAQTVSVTGPLGLTGGTGGAPDLGNFAQIRAIGSQNITAGSAMLAAGGAGFSNFAGIHSPDQDITIHGDLTLTGGNSVSGPTSAGAARIGGIGGAIPGPTNLVLNVDGNFTTSGGTEASAGAVIGSAFQGGQPTDIAMIVGGNVTLNPGTVANAGSRIGSPSGAPAGGNISVTAGGDLFLNSAPGLVGSVIRTTDSIALQADSIVQGPNARIQAGSLATNTANGASLTGDNQVASFNATNTTSGDVALNNATPLLTVTGVNQTSSGALTINQAGDLTLTGTISSGPQTFNATGSISVLPGSPAFVNAFGPQSITAGEGLVVQSSAAGAAQLLASGGQTINARYIEVTAQDNPAFVSNNLSGDQLITTTGMNASGEGLALRNLGGPGAFATIAQNVTGGRQQISVNNAERMTVDGIGGNALIFDNSGIQAISITGAASANALNLGSPGSLGASQIGGGGTQTVTAGLAGEQGSITIIGKAAGSGGNSIIVSNAVPGGIQTVSTPGTLTVIGGTSPAGTSAAGIFANGIGGQQTINAGAIALQGGPGGSGNNAQIGALNGAQQITVGADGISLLGGAGGTNNAAVIFGATQDISTMGNVTLGGGFGSGNSARIGGRGGANPGPTDLTLSAGGNVALTGNAASNTVAVIGSAGAGPLELTQIAINAGGNVVLSGGTGAGARIGSPAPATGGDISITAGNAIQVNGNTRAATIRTLGNVQLHADSPGGTISEDPNGAVQANALITTSNGNTSLTGANLVSAFNASSVSGNVALNNTSPLLTVTGISQAPVGALTLNQTGDLAITGNVVSGPQSISATGDITVVAGSSTTLSAAGPQMLNAGGTLLVQGGATSGGSASITGNGPVSVSTGGDLSLMGGSGQDAYALLFSNGDINLTVGGALRMNQGTGERSWARVQTATRDSVISIFFPNLSSGGFFVNDFEGALRRGQTGLLSGEGVAVPDHTLIIEYAQ